MGWEPAAIGALVSSVLSLVIPALTYPPCVCTDGTLVVDSGAVLGKSLDQVTSALASVTAPSWHFRSFVFGLLFGVIISIGCCYKVRSLQVRLGR